MILIVTQPLDVHADHVAEKLQHRGADFVRFDPAQFPKAAEVSLSYIATGEAQYRLKVGEETINLNSVTAVWYRRPRFPIAHEAITDNLRRDFVEWECQTVIDDMWNSLDCLYVPAPHSVMERAQLKISQLKLAAILGFELPPTLVTNSPTDFLEFYRQHNGHIISKRAGFSFFRTVGAHFCRFTEVVSKRDVGYAHSIRYCPVIFQSYVSKRVELRITVVGYEVFAVEIHSQESNHTRYDWRRYDHNKTQYSQHELPREVEQRCVALVQRLGLCYGAIDMVLTPDGRYVFLEINPNGQYLWTEQATGLPISDAICDMLISGASVYKPVECECRSYPGGVI